MNILFDLVATQAERNLKYHGGSEYAKAVFWAVVKKTTVHLYCIFDSGRSLDKEIELYCRNNNLILIDITNSKNLNSIIDEYNIERFYTALPLEKKIQQLLPLGNNVRSIITIHGLRSLELLSDKYELKYMTGLYSGLKYLYKRFFPGKYKSRLLLRIKQLIKNYSDPVIITVSDYSRHSFEYFIPEIPAERIHTLYSPIRDYQNDIADETILLKNGLEPKKYFLLLSAGVWQKNSFRMLSAFDELIKETRLKGYKLVVMGAPVKIKKSFPESCYIFLDYLERPGLEALFRNAYALLYPSLNEGFGYPPLEAFKYGTGVIASSIGPVKEVCGNEALFFNPYSIIEMKLKLLQSLNDPDFLPVNQQRIDQYLKVRQKQLTDLDMLVSIICD